MKVNLNRQLLGIEDLLFGTGTVEQVRGGQTVNISKIDLGVLPWDNTTGETIAEYIQRNVDEMQQAIAYVSVEAIPGTTAGATYDTVTNTITFTLPQGPQGPQGIQGIQGLKGDVGDDGRGIVSVVKTSGTGAAGTTDVYTITYTDASQSSFNVYNGDDGRGIVSVVKTSGTGAAGTTDVYTITYTDASQSSFNVYNGADGLGSGDMLKATYDTNNNGKVDLAEVADKWTTGRTLTVGSTGKSIDGSGNVSWSLAEIGAQTLDADLTAIAALAGTSGLLKKTAANTWALDTAAYTTNLGTVTGVTGTAPIVSSGGTAPAISISAATTSAAGSMSAVDKTKLDGIATSANNYVHPTNDGSLHVPATGTTNAGKVLMAGTTAGSLSWTTIPAGVTDHTLLSNIGTNTHAQIDTALTRLVNTSGTNTGDQTTITGNAGSATVLQTARTINGVSFNGSANITVSDSTAVNLTAAQTIDGIKTFSSSPVVPTPTANTQAANKAYVDSNSGGTFVANDSKVKTALNATGTAPIYACRAWVNFNGTGTVAIIASGNVSSITDNGVGNYTVNFTTAMPNANYSVSSSTGAVSGVGTGEILVDTYSISSFKIRTYNSAGTSSFDFYPISASIFI